MVIAVADFVEDKAEGEGHSWNTAKSKMFDFVRRGVGTNDRVSDRQMEILRQFTATGITVESVKAKSSAASNIVAYLLAMSELQEHLFNLAQPDELPAEDDPERFAGANRNSGSYGAVDGARKNDLHDLYYAR